MDQATASALKHQFTAEQVMNMNPDMFCTKLILAGLVKSGADFNLLVLEAIQKAAMDDDEFPIHFYTEDEPMSESGRTVNNVECLTDDYIANMMGGC